MITQPTPRSTIPRLAALRIGVLSLSAALVTSSPSNAAQPPAGPEDRSAPCDEAAFGVASSYQLVAFQDVELEYSDTEGTVAVGGRARFLGYSIGEKVPKGLNFYYNVTKELEFRNGGVSNGPTAFSTLIDDLNVAFCRDGTANFLQPCAEICQNGICNETPLDFARAKAEIVARGELWKNVPTPLHGTVSRNNGTVELGLPATNLDAPPSAPIVFDIPNGTFNGASEILFSIATPHRNRTILVNIPGTQLSFQNFGINCRGDHGIQSCLDAPRALLNRQRLVWNFHQAISIEISGAAWIGALVAPNAMLRFTNGQIRGRVIVDSWKKTTNVAGQVNLPYEGSSSITTREEWNSFLFDGDLPAC